VGRPLASFSGAVEADNPRVRQAVYAALGEIGEPGDLDVLRRCAEPSDPHAAPQLRFASALIAHRHGLVGPMLDGGPPREHEPGPADEMIELSLRSKALRTVERDAARWKGSRYGIDVGKLGFELRAGRAEWTVFVNGTLGKTASTLSSIFERPFIAAILGRWNAEHLALNTQYVALTHPSDEGAVIVVARGDGEIMYTGTAAKLADEITYTVSDVERPGTAPTTVAGTVGRRTLDVKVAVPFGTRFGTRMTSDVRPV
jgi:hypothetical protein